MTGGTVKVGLLGLGSIGQIVLRHIRAGDLGPYEMALGVDSRAERRLVAEQAGVPFSDQPADLLAAGLDLVVETASQQAVREWAEPILATGISMVILSVGALADAALFNRLEQAAVEGDARVYVPSGAVGGLDVLKGAAFGDLRSVHLTTTKPPGGLAGAPAVAGMDLSALTSQVTVFTGSAAEAAANLPQNLNVAVALALVGVGPDRTRVDVVADPFGDTNIHRVVAEGEFGRLELAVHNRPSPDNPRTSYLAVLSTLALLRNLNRRIRIGT